LLHGDNGLAGFPQSHVVSKDGASLRCQKGDALDLMWIEAREKPEFLAVALLRAGDVCHGLDPF